MGAIFAFLYVLRTGGTQEYAEGMLEPQQRMLACASAGSLVRDNQRAEKARKYCIFTPKGHSFRGIFLQKTLSDARADYTTSRMHPGNLCAIIRLVAQISRGVSNWKLAGLITRRLRVQIPSPLLSFYDIIREAEEIHWSLATGEEEYFQ